MVLKKRNKILLISLLVLLVLMFSFVFFRPAFLNKLFSQPEGFPTKARERGYALVKNPKETLAIDVPEKWTLNNYPDSEGYVSYMTVQSPDFKVEANPDDAFGMLGASLKSGVKLEIAVIKSPEGFFDKPQGTISRTEDYEVLRKAGKYFVYTDPGLADAVSHEVRFAYKGNVYFIKMLFNPNQMKDGEQFFKHLLSTLALK